MDLYVYYRVRTSDAEAFLARARGYVEQLRAEERVDASLSRRPESTDGLDTWMEVIPQAGDACEHKLLERVASSGIGAFIQGERHLERFERLI
ncbi:MAG: hypothetical protein JWP41_2322 [Ramlibacter sp.]|jgi:hypothetical protein|nr:hypothetical protein [Ramlibacter sp.]